MTSHTGNRSLDLLKLGCGNLVGLELVELENFCTPSQVTATFTGFWGWGTCNYGNKKACCRRIAKQTLTRSANPLTLGKFLLIR